MTDPVIPRDVQQPSLSVDSEVEVPGPVTPSAQVREELDGLLGADESRLGDVYRGTKQGLDAQQIAHELGIDSSNFVWNYSRMIRALLDGDMPTAPTVALGVVRKHRALLKTSGLSKETVAYLETNLRHLEQLADDQRLVAAEDAEARRQTEQAEARSEVGIYVYALPHYLRHPYEPSTGRTLMKIGRSDSDVIIRFRHQTRTTALPEEPVLLRIYRTGDRPTTPFESRFHRLLEAADHARSVARSAGREWFLTSTRFLDEIARTLELGIHIVTQISDIED